MSPQGQVTRQLPNGFGPYQRRLFMALCLITGIMNAFRLVTLFVAYVPPHRCWVDELEELNQVFDVPDDTSGYGANSTVGEIEAYIPLERTSAGHYEWNQCSRVNGTPISNVTSKSLKPCNNGWSYLTGPGVVSAVTEFDLVCERSWAVPLIPTILLVGFMLCSLVGGYISDRYGRKSSLLLCFGLMLVGALGMAWTPVVAGVHIGMLLVGMPSVISTTSAVIFIRESTSPKLGEKLGLVLLVCTSVGNLLTPAFAYFIPNWRWMLTAMAIVAFSTMPLAVFLVEESVVWLQQYDSDRAKKVISRIAKINRFDPETLENTNLKPSHEDFAKYVPFEEEGQDSEKNERSDTAPTQQERLNFMQLLKAPFLRKSLIAVTVAFFSASIVYYGLSLNANRLSGDIYLNCFLSALVDIPGDIFGSFLVVRLGCRRSFVLCTLACGALLLSTPLIKIVSDIGEVVCSMAAKFFVGGSCVVVHLFTGDFFPTVLRNQAYGASSSVARVGGIIVPYILYLGEVAHFSVPYLAMGVCCVLAVASAYTLPETKGLELPVTLDDARELEKYRPRLDCGRRCSKKSQVDNFAKE